MSRAIPGQRAAGFLLGLLLVVTAVRAEPSLDEQAKTILASIPAASAEDQSEWLWTRACEESDGWLALRLMTALAERGGTRAAPALLWQVRFWLAAGEQLRAVEILRPLEAPPPDAPWASEARYWRTQLGLADADAEFGGVRSIPPWELMRGIAALGREETGGERTRRALALEGAARRLGLLGPWLWRLAESGDPELRRTGKSIFEGAGGALASAPEREALAQRLARGEEGFEALPPTPEGERERPPPAEDPRPGRFAVQVGSYHEKRTADEVVRELGTHGFEAHLAMEMPPDAPPVYRVRLGPSASLAEAESIGVALSRELLLPYQVVEVP